jgi:hypothetical protein
MVNLDIYFALPEYRNRAFFPFFKSSELFKRAKPPLQRPKTAGTTN